MSSKTIKEAAARTRRFRAFISYSHSADGRLAPALEDGLEGFSKPWYRLRAMRVFRDQTGLAITPELWESIEKALRDSDYFLLLASPRAAQSKWIEQEVDWWLDNRPASQLLIILSEGELVWDGAASDYDWDKTDALPRRLQKVFSREPLYLDLRWARNAADLSLRRPRFAEAIAGLAATLLGKSLDDLIGEDVRQHTRTLGLLRLAGATLLALTVFALFAAFVALQARNTALRVARGQETNAVLQAREAQSRQLATTALNQADPELGLLLAIEAVRRHPTEEAESALRQALAGPQKAALSLQPAAAYNHAVFSPDGTRVLAWGESTARIHDGSSGRVLIELRGSTNEIFHASFNFDGRRVCTVSGDGIVRLWDVQTGVTTAQFLQENAGAALWNPDGNRLLTTTEYEAVLWDTSTGARVGEFECAPNPVYFDHISGASFHPDGSRLALCSRVDPMVFDARTGSPLLTLEGHSRPARSVEFSPDGNWLITASEDGTVRKWRAASGQCVAVWKNDAELYEVRFSPDGKWVAARDGNKVVTVWEAETGRKSALIELQPKPTQPLTFAFSPNGKCLLVASFEAGLASIWETRTGSRLALLTGEEPEAEPRTLRFSPDGRRALIGSYGAPARIFPCEICGSVDDLLTLAQRRVRRELTAAERERYLAEPRRP